MGKRILKELKDRRVCNKKAPRWRRSRYAVVSRNNMTVIKENNSDVLSGYTPLQLQHLVKDFNEYVVDYMLNNRDYVELPYMMGDMWIAVFGKGGKIDLTKSDEIEKEIRFRNNHTDGYGTKLFYTTDYKITKSTPYRHLWILKPCRRVGLRIKEEIEKGRWKDFMVCDGNRYLDKFIRAMKKKNAHNTYKKYEFAQYDEFYINEEDN